MGDSSSSPSWSRRHFSNELFLLFFGLSQLHMCVFIQSEGTKISLQALQDISYIYKITVILGMFCGIFFVSTDLSSNYNQTRWTQCKHGSDWPNVTSVLHIYTLVQRELHLIYKKASFIVILSARHTHKQRGSFILLGYLLFAENSRPEYWFRIVRRFPLPRNLFESCLIWFLSIARKAEI